MNGVIRKILFFSIFFAVIPYSAFGNLEETSEVSETKTLKEMQENIQDLEKEKIRLEFRWNTFRIGNENLGDLLRSDISASENTELEMIITNYITVRDSLEEDIDNAVIRLQDTSLLQEELFLLKKDFYDSLLIYIDTEKTSAFLIYIQSDISYNEKSKEVATEIEVQEGEKAERVEEIQEKIEDNSEILRKQIEEKIQQNLQSKLDEFIAQEKFQNLDNSSKIILFEKLLEKVEVKKEILLETENPTSIIEERIILMEIVQEVISSYISVWRD